MHRDLIAGAAALTIFGLGGLAVHANATMAKDKSAESLEEFLVQQPVVDDVTAHAERMKKHAEAEKRKAEEPPKQDPAAARAAALRDQAEFGMIGLLNSGAGGDPDAPTAPWGRDDSLGTDVGSAGNVWGDSIGESFGAGGLGLSGIGTGGTGSGEGVGLGSVGTIGKGGGASGYGSGSGRFGRSSRARPPRVRMGTANVTGSLPKEVIQRIVRQNFGRFRLCYESGLKNNPNLQGRVSVRFTIKADGTVTSVSGGGDIPDQGVVSCVTRAFYGLTFPQTDGGIVTVSYPIVFSPGTTSTASKKPATAKKKKLRVRFKSVRGGGRIEAKAIKKLLKRKRSKFRKCYREAYAKDSTLKGSIRLSFTVTPEGDVVIGKREDMVLSTFSDEVADCVLGVLDDLTFPAPTGGAAIVSFGVAFGG